MLQSLSICLISFVVLFILAVSLVSTGFYFLMCDQVYFIEWEVLSMNSGNIVMTFLFDWMSLIFMGFVLFISSLVIFYSQEYMAGDLNLNRFILLVLMFVLSMMFLIISPNLISILLGWDGLGLVSYLLVIYYQNVKSYNAGMLTALSNRIGDVALLLAIAWMLNFGSWNYIFYLDCSYNSTEMKIIGALVLLAAMTKSAQIPFSSWLPAAMAAPTPVSALVHSSTLVTAGIYLLIRFNALLVGTSLGSFLLLVAGLTMFMAGLGANFEFDLKKIIALSTLSQLGLMMSILAMGFPKLAFFHLLTHALFKALLFMCAGAIIHNMKDSQDIRYMGALVINMPLTASCFNLSNLALCGTPFLAGFYSKDLILEVASLSYMNVFSFFLYFFSTGLTVCYSLRLVYYSMSGDFNTFSLHPLSDEGWVMLRGMMALSMMAVLGGSLLSWGLFPTPSMVCLPLTLKTLALSVSVLGGWLGYELAKFSLTYRLQTLRIHFLTSFMGSMWFMPFISTYGVSKSPLQLGGLVSKSFDHGWSEYFGGQGVYQFISLWSKFSQGWQNNDLKTYLISFILWIIILLFLLAL
uniref:NADH-ubiquinone oxidoreductase chain 5 n=1 Tax=Lednia tumana TaxID=466727 RepID=A0A4D6Q063_9NEOP|nr:NADH dehydrogenase subunit 5 [Lednia tumana]QCF39717.1 NADH dehydrogenase subunit 5 [Lednia tumana]WOL43206.1 NADH dehydrogenase subunit 5 [Lednia tumana]